MKTLNTNRLSSSPVSGAVKTPKKRDDMARDIVETYRLLGVDMTDEDQARIRKSLDVLNERIEDGDSILITGDTILTASVEVMT